ncbi:MAG TPA: class I SAM-dependent methyltransferase [Burkholderiales bacterium]|nr:class I SAM-dependent methyltransferase [Burkholderiales bacterium]
MTTSDDTLKQYYAARAREYEQIYLKPERQADLKRIAERLPPLMAGRRMLEVAYGTGYWTQVLAPVARAIVAIDANRETLDVAGEKSWPANRVEFRIADAYALPDDLGVFDAAFAGFWWSHIPVLERARFFASLHQRLTPGAVVVLLDNLYVAGSSTPISQHDHDGNTYQRRRLKNGSEHRVMKNFPTEQALVADVAHCARAPCFNKLDYYWLFQYVFQPGDEVTV